MLVLGLDGHIGQCLSREQLAHSKGAIEESLMKALLPEGRGGRMEHLRLAPAGSSHYLGLKGLAEEAGFTEPRRAAPWPGSEACSVHRGATQHLQKGRQAPTWSSGREWQTEKNQDSVPTLWVAFFPREALVQTGLCSPMNIPSPAHWCTQAWQ